MSHATIANTIEDFFRAPTLDRFLTAQALVVESTAYDPAATAITKPEHQLSRGFRVSATQLKLLPLEFQLCPRYYYLGARVHEELGANDEVRWNVRRLQACLRALAESGDGSAEEPFKVTFLTDPDDLIRAFGESTRCQQIVATKSGYCDVLTTHSGHDFWFDIEPLLEHSSVSAVSGRNVLAK